MNLNDNGEAVFIRVPCIWVHDSLFFRGIRSILRPREAKETERNKNGRVGEAWTKFLGHGPRKRLSLEARPFLVLPILLSKT